MILPSSCIKRQLVSRGQIIRCRETCEIDASDSLFDSRKEPERATGGNPDAISCIRKLPRRREPISAKRPARAL